MATKLDIVSVDQIGNRVMAEHFGGNLVYTKNNDASGAGNAEFWQGAEAVGVTDIRYPGGTVAETDIDIVQMPDGQLRPEVVAFFEQLQNEYAEVAGEPRQAILVLRTQKWIGESDAEWAENIERFVEAVTREYGHLISAFQIGNEYWNVEGANHNEYSYGRRADLAAVAIQAGIAESGSAYDPEIVIQMANPATAGSAFGRADTAALMQIPFEYLSDVEQRFLLSAAERQGVSVDQLDIGRMWYDRIEFANRTIFEQLSPEAVEAMDAVVEHYYIRDPIEELTFNFTNAKGNINSSLVSNIDLKYRTWSEGLERDFQLYITEWGLNLKNESNHGIKEGSITLEQFEHMIKLGVDNAFAWPVVHNTEVSLGARLGKETRTDDMGVTIENHRGTVFDLMATNLIGLNQMDVSHLNADAPFEVNAYGNEEKMVFYISSRTETVERISFDVDALGLEFTAISGVHIGYGETYAPGATPDQFYSSRWADEIEYKTVDGEVLFFTDDNMQAAITHLHEGALFQGRKNIEVNLKPFEMVELVYLVRDGEVVDGNGGNNQLFGTVRNDVLRGFDGNDILVGDEGADRLEGGEGRDMADYSHAVTDMAVNLSWTLANSGLAENDRYVSIEDVAAGEGDDKITGNGSDNRLLGGHGQDTLVGLDGDDLLFGGDHDDRLVGHRGDDQLFGGEGDDMLFGDPGDDLLQGGKGNDHLTGGRGADVFVFRRGDGSDVIEDFSLGEDQLDLSAHAPGDMTMTADNASGSIHLTFGETDKIEIIGVTDVEALEGSIIW